MSRSRTQVLALLLSILLVMQLPPVVPGVLGRDVITGSASGVRVSVDGPWVYAAEASGEDGDVDTLVFTYRSGNVVVTGGSRDVDDVLDALPEKSRVSDIDVSNTYALRSVHYNGSTYGLFSAVIREDVHTVIAPVDDFASIIKSARTNVSVNDAEVFMGVDEKALARLLPDGEASRMPLIDADETAVGTPNPPPATAIVLERSIGTPAATATPVTIQPGRHTRVAGWSGVRITWNDQWQIGTENGKPTVSSSLEGYQYDEICLQPTAGSDSIDVCVLVTWAGSIDNADGWSAKYASPAAKSVFGTPYYYVEVTDTSVTYADFDVEGDVASISQTDLVDGRRITVRVTGPLNELAELAEQASAGVQVDGRPVLDKVDAEQFRFDTEAVITKLPTWQEERDAYLSSMGLQNSHHYASTAMGCDVEWTTPLQLDHMTTTMPIRQSDAYGFEPEVSSERLTLVWTTADLVQAPIVVDCLAGMDSVDSWTSWVEATESPLASRYVTVESPSAYYMVDGTGRMLIVVKPLGGPAVIVAIPAGADGLRATMESLDPGMLIVNGIDVFRVFENDGIAGLLP